MLPLKRFLALVCSFFVLQTFGHAQCPSPDNLDGGPCCTITTPSLPFFKSFIQPALDICWRDCNVDTVIPLTARWKNVNTSPVPPSPCLAPMMTLDLFAPGGIAWTGKLRRQYSRTWIEVDPGGTTYQVWRFLVNGDMTPTALAGPVPCPVPPCAPAFGGRVRFTGYLDYAKNCATGIFHNAWMISHVCDPIDHNPGFPRGGMFHPDRSYTFVGPSAGFVPGPIQPIEGTPGSALEAVRRVNLPPPGATGTTCEYEENISYSLMPIQQLCLCAAMFPATPQWLIANLMLAGACGTTITTPGGPFLPGFISMGIGSWTIPGTYPGVERLRWNAGGYDYGDPCIGTARREVFFGATTIDGWFALQLPSFGPGVPLPLTFIDQSNSLRLNPAVTVMNLPYFSDHFLNLNH